MSDVKSASALLILFHKQRQLLIDMSPASIAKTVESRVFQDKITGESIELSKSTIYLWEEVKNYPIAMVYAEESEETDEQGDDCQEEEPRSSDGDDSGSDLKTFVVNDSSDSEPGDASGKKKRKRKLRDAVKGKTKRMLSMCLQRIKQPKLKAVAPSPEKEDNILDGEHDNPEMDFTEQELQQTLWSAWRDRDSKLAYCSCKALLSKEEGANVVIQMICRAIVQCALTTKKGKKQSSQFICDSLFYCIASSLLFQKQEPAKHAQQNTMLLEAVLHLCHCRQWGAAPTSNTVVLSAMPAPAMWPIVKTPGALAASLCLMRLLESLYPDSPWRKAGHELFLVTGFKFRRCLLAGKPQKHAGQTLKSLQSEFDDDKSKMFEYIRERIKQVTPLNALELIFSASRNFKDCLLACAFGTSEDSLQKLVRCGLQSMGISQLSSTLSNVLLVLKSCTFEDEDLFTLMDRKQAMLVKKLAEALKAKPKLQATCTSEILAPPASMDMIAENVAWLANSQDKSTLESLFGTKFVAESEKLVKSKVFSWIKSMAPLSWGLFPIETAWKKAWSRFMSARHTASIWHKLTQSLVSSPAAGGLLMSRDQIQSQVKKLLAFVKAGSSPDFIDDWVLIVTSLLAYACLYARTLRVLPDPRASWCSALMSACFQKFVTSDGHVLSPSDPLVFETHVNMLVEQNILEQNMPLRLHSSTSYADIAQLCKNVLLKDRKELPRRRIEDELHRVWPLWMDVFRSTNPSCTQMLETELCTLKLQLLQRSSVLGRDLQQNAGLQQEVKALYGHMLLSLLCGDMQVFSPDLSGPCKPWNIVESATNSDFAVLLGVIHRLLFFCQKPWFRALGVSAAHKVMCTKFNPCPRVHVVNIDISNVKDLVEKLISKSVQGSFDVLLTSRKEDSIFQSKDNFLVCDDWKPLIEKLLENSEFRLNNLILTQSVSSTAFVSSLFSEAPFSFGCVWICVRSSELSSRLKAEIEDFAIACHGKFEFSECLVETI